MGNDNFHVIAEHDPILILPLDPKSVPERQVGAEVIICGRGGGEDGSQEALVVGSEAAASRMGMKAGSSIIRLQTSLGTISSKSPPGWNTG